MIEGSMSISPKAAQRSDITIDEKAADDYAVQINRTTGQVRVAHRSAAHGLISYQDLDADEAYAFAQAILRGYDQLEGIDS